MTSKPVVLAALCVVAASSGAKQMHKCEIDGQTVLQNFPCAKPITRCWAHERIYPGDHPACTGKPATPKPKHRNAELKWFQGGTLHKASISEWASAEYRNRLATSADYFTSIAKKQNPDRLDVPKSRFLAVVRAHAVELEKCITGVAADKEILVSLGTSLTAAELAAFCHTLMFP